jgi:hypothetical protein
LLAALLILFKPLGPESQVGGVSWTAPKLIQVYGQYVYGSNQPQFTHPSDKASIVKVVLRKELVEIDFHRALSGSQIY